MLCAMNVSKDAPDLEISQSLKSLLSWTDDRNIPYVCMEGMAHPDGMSFKSRYNNDYEGLIHKLNLVEHKSKRTGGYWTDSKHVIRDVIDTVPFHISPPDDPTCHVLITDPLSANYLCNELSTTFNHYDQSQNNFIKQGIDRIYGEVSKGIEETEEMLLVGTKLLGIGKLILENQSIKLIPPDNGGSYILTKMSKPELLRSLTNSTWWLKFVSGIFGFIGMGLLVHLCYKYVNRILRHRRQRDMIAEMRTMMNTGDDTAGIDDDNLCQVCLENPRNIVLLECGHICLCSNCFELLPIPALCPICRGIVSRIVPTFVS